MILSHRRYITVKLPSLLCNLFGMSLKKPSNIGIGLTYLLKTCPRYMSRGIFDSLRIYDRTKVKEYYKASYKDSSTLFKQKISEKNEAGYIFIKFQYFRNGF